MSVIGKTKSSGLTPRAPVKSNKSSPLVTPRSQVVTSRTPGVTSNKSTPMKTLKTPSATVAKPAADDAAVRDAKSFLLTSSSKTGLNLYDHLAKVLTQILNERPRDAVDIVEEISLSAKNDLRSSADTIRDKPDRTEQLALAQLQEKLFSKQGDDADDDGDAALPNLVELFYYFEQAGVGLSREEIIRIWLSLKQLIDSRPIESIRFWGKVLGTEQNYIVAECTVRDGEEEEEEEEEEDVDESKELGQEDSPEQDEDEENEDGEPRKVDNIPKPNYKRPPAAPKEPNRTGVNRKTYYVTNDPGRPWLKLPLLTPAQIVAARRVKKFLTGRLDAPIVSYPPFPGNEANYLRAQIARISAGTQISPVGYYQFDEDEDDNEDGGRERYVINTEYEPMNVRDLADPSLSNWVHHVLHILPQGRTRWWNPVQKREEEVEDNEDDDDKEEQEEVVPEVGPPLLTPIADDADVSGFPAWSVSTSSRLVSQFACAVVHSCVWPGAHAFASGRLFENVYVGWGHKYSARNHNPSLPPVALSEYPTVTQPMEIDDPTPAQEAALKAETQAAVEGEQGDGEDDNDDQGGIAEEDEENNEDDDD